MNLTLSHTQLEKFEECQRKYKYIYENKLQPEVGIAAEFSSQVIHPSLEHLYLHGDTAEVPWFSYWNAFVEKIGLEKLGDARYALDMAKRVYEAILPYYYDDVLHYTNWQAEEPARPSLGTITVDDETLVEIEYISKPDLIGYEVDSYGKIYMDDAFVFDFKFGSSDQSALSLDFHRQFMGQAWAHGAKGFVCYAISVGRTKVRPSVGVMRYETIPTQFQLDEFVAEVRVKAQQRLICQLANVWPKQSPKACYSFGKPCEFLNICQAGPFAEAAIKRRGENQQ